MDFLLRSITIVAVFLSFNILFYVLAEIDFDDNYTTEPGEEEWHMDFMPTGYLPDGVYREIAWYGILQIKPIHHSSKYKVAAQLIWQHTLGRPHVIMESPPQSTQSPGKIGRQVLADNAAKWSREQRAAQEVLMENIKSGGNGLTVRTVVSGKTKTAYIIHNGNYYKCPKGSEPDIDTYRVQANMHDRKCTYGKSSYQLPIDPCIEAETAPIEYSFHEGWMFCLGNGDRENNYFQNGTLDCGNKTKITVDEVLDQCAIDNNIVILFEYFGDEPRKDLMHNATICTTWDPCRVSYLYRLEPPPVEMTPAFPTSTQNPCETTVCPECLEDSEDLGVPIEILSDDEQDIPVPSFEGYDVGDNNPSNGIESDTVAHDGDDLPKTGESSDGTKEGEDADDEALRSRGRSRERTRAHSGRGTRKKI
ncbi:uncharacterized protein LOC113229665 [Hyposmocoma kahamanoa]|uniref:uncharacterized protein LOC113229665 n=1 Tax=Hyposmocoma kahamanoa TaxID=1477025 RepID=UPI000E6D824B|nr:uncharacterized protein LOC113229665 [Hyposmocoma kahamanoa]